MRRAPLKRPTVAAPRGPGVSGWFVLLAGVLAAVVYANALHNPFVYDDHDTVLSNRSLADPSNIRFLLVYTPFRPVVNVSYGLDRFIWGPDPFGFHVTSVALHAVASMLFCVLLQRLLWDAGARRWSGVAAFAGAAMFAVHPLQTEAVGYVSGRSELLCAVWFFASVLAARRAVTTGSAGAGAVALACGLVALASKEVALVLPLIVLAYAWLLAPASTGASGDTQRRENASAPAVTSRRLLPIFLTAAVVLIAAGMYRLAAFGFLSGGTDVYTSVLNVLTQTIVIWRYVALLVWPHGQSIMHAVHRVTSPADPLALAALAGLAVVVAVAFTRRRSAPLLTLGVLWFLAVLAPSSSIIPLREGMAEHRVYLASAGLFLVVAQQLARWLEGAAVRAPRVRWAGAAVFCVLVILGTPDGGEKPRLEQCRVAVERGDRARSRHVGAFVCAWRLTAGSG